LKVCYFGTYRENYSRNKILIAALRSAGIEVIECHVPLWHGIEDRVNVTSGGWLSPKFWWRAIKVYLTLLWKYRKIDTYDILMVGYPGQVDVYLARILADLKKKPLVWDVFMSLYLIAKERSLDNRSLSAVKFIRKIEAKALSKPDLLLQDTAEYVKWFQKEYGIEPDKFALVPTGADDRIFKPLQPSEKRDALFHVLYYGTFIANHGVKLIVQAAELLQDQKDIVFEMIGDGPEKENAEKFIQSNSLSNVHFYDWMNQQELLKFITEADVCLGAFGETPQSLMTVQNKIYECMAMGKAVITGTSPAIQQSFENGEHLLIVDRVPNKIVDGIIHLHENPIQKKKIADGGMELFYSKYDLINLGRVLKFILYDICEEKRISRVANK
jgi:glycosyltransferase involved in cell wall biosynthesis